MNAWSSAACDQCGTDRGVVDARSGLDVKIVQEVLGDSTSVLTGDTCQHVRRRVHKDAAQKVVDLLPGQEDAQEAGS